MSEQLGMTYSTENYLVNYRITKKCCATCDLFDSGYEGSGDCKIMIKLKEEKEDQDKNIWVHTGTSIHYVCDNWKAPR